LSVQAAPAEGPKWYRGQLHAHSCWSDGLAFPEQVVAAYKERGYNFLSLTDHNRFQSDTNAWRQVLPKEGATSHRVSRRLFDSYARSVPRDWIDARTNESEVLVRLKTWGELKSLFEKPGDFILLPGTEVTQVFNGRNVHLNCINLPVLLPSVDADSTAPRRTTDVLRDVDYLLGLNVSEAEQTSRNLKRPYLLGACRNT